MRTVLLLIVGLVLAYYAGGFETGLTLVRGSVGEVNGALAGR